MPPIDVVDYREVTLAFSLAQPAPELLGPKQLRFRRTQHENRVDVGEINTLIEHVDGEDDLEIARLEPLE